jgi:hypothetical protein
MRQPRFEGAAFDERVLRSLKREVVRRDFVGQKSAGTWVRDGTTRAEIQAATPGKEMGRGRLQLEALKPAPERLDATFRISLDEDDLEAVGEGYDCVVMGDFERLKQP